MFPGCGNCEPSEMNVIVWLWCRSLGFWSPLLILESVPCSWLVAVPGQPLLSRLPVLGSGMWVALHPAGPIRGKQPQRERFSTQSGEWLAQGTRGRADPKGEKLSSRMTFPLCIPQGKGLSGIHVVPFRRLDPRRLIPSLPSRAELFPSPSIPCRVLPDSFPVSFGPRHPGCLCTGTGPA